MAKNSSVNLDITNLSVGFQIGGGTTLRYLVVNGAGNTTLTSQQTIILTLPNRATDTVVGYGDYSAKGTILVGTGAGTFTALAVGSDGQVLTAASGQTSGTEWAGAPGTLTWNDITDESSPTQMVSLNGYFSDDPANSGSFALPVSSAQFDIIEITNLQAAQNFTITVGTGQSIQYGSVSTTPTTGTLSSTAIGDSLRLICTVADTTWQALSIVGNLAWT